MLIGSCPVSGDWYEADIAERIGDYSTAFREYKALADDGEIVALHNLGVMYYNGSGVHRNYEKAIQCFLKAAEQGIAGSQNNLGYIYAHGHGVQKNYVKSKMWFNIANLNGEKTANKNLEIIDTLMTSTEREEAMKLAREWIGNFRQ
ncbi:MAG: tetratricopeptide repeat protein [Pseudomonadota bacterium]|nr:tetratricopeptide repeat protein [Pseudomonadota bacterium]